MSTAAVAPSADAAPAKGKKKLILLVAVVLLLVLGGGAALLVMKKKAAEAAAAAEADDEDHARPAHAKPKDGKGVVPPTFLPLEPFVVNLADKETDRYAQIGITLEIADAPAAEQLKAYMPAIRNGILMVLAHKTSAELLERKGKEQLAREIMREAVRPLGIEIEEEEDEEAAAKGDEAQAKPKAKPKKKRKTPAEDSPVRHVHFSNFIIQ